MTTQLRSLSTGVTRACDASEEKPRKSGHNETEEFSIPPEAYTSARKGTEKCEFFV
jgi:hypothetical protein